MRSLIIAFVGAVVFSSQAVGADAAKNFEGFSVQFGTGYQSVKGKTSNLVTVPASVVSVSDSTMNEVPAVLGVAYTFALTDKFLLGVDFEYDALKSKDGQSNVFLNNALIVNGGSKNKTQDVMTLSLKPGYVVNDTTAIYAKLGYFTTKSTCTNDDASACASTNFKGYTLGGGAKMLIDKNVYLFAEASYIKASDKAGRNGTTTFTTGAQGYNTIIGAGYKF